MSVNRNHEEVDNMCAYSADAMSLLPLIRANNQLSTRKLTILMQYDKTKQQMYQNTRNCTGMEICNLLELNNLNDVIMNAML